MGRQQPIDRWRHNGTVVDRLSAILRRLVLAMPMLLVMLAFTNGNPAVPAYAASSLTTKAPSTGPIAIDLAQVQLMMQNAAPPTAEQLALVTAYFAAHPLQITVKTTSAPPSKGGIQPDLSVYVYWWGVRIHLTNADVVSLFTLIVEAGAGAVAGFLCLEGGPLAIACAIIGAVVGWIIVTAVLQATYNFYGCGLNIDYNYWYGWRWYCA